MMLYALGGALKGDKNFVQNTLALQEMQEGKAKEKARIETLRKTVTNPEFAAKYPWAKDMYDLAGADALSPIVSGIASSYKPTTDSVERFGVVDTTTGKRVDSVLKIKAEDWKQSNQDPNLMLVPLAADATKDQKEQYYQVVGPLNERLRISTMDDYFKGMESGLYPAGSTVVNIPTGTEAPKSQVENIELFSAENKPYAERWQATSTLHGSLQGYADNLAKSDEAALTGVGATVKYVDGLIQNTKGFLKLASDDTQNFYNNAKAENTSLQSATGFKPFVNPLTQATSSQATGGPSVEERLNNPLYQ
jgi:hypothetical protein